MATTLHIHVPLGDPMLDHMVDVFFEEGSVTGYYDEGDSYREWGETRRGDDPAHVVLIVPADKAESVYHDLGQAGIHVDVTLEDDHAAVVTWGQVRYPGWHEYFRKA